MQKNRISSTQKLTLLALFTALQIVLGKLTQISIVGKEFNFGFLPIAAAGSLLGFSGGMIVGALGDLIGSLLFPTGAYFPGFTLTAALVGAVYGLLLEYGRIHWARVAVAVVATEGINLLLNSLWLSMLYTSRAYWGWVVVRSSAYLVEAPLQILVVFFALRGLEKIDKNGTILSMTKQE